MVVLKSNPSWEGKLFNCDCLSSYSKSDTLRYLLLKNVSLWFLGKPLDIHSIADQCFALNV